MKNIKQIILASLLFVSTFLSAQERRPVRDRVDAMKIGFLTDRLNLSPEEAKVLEKNIENAMELVLKSYFYKK